MNLNYFCINLFSGFNCCLCKFITVLLVPWQSGVPSAGWGNKQRVNCNEKMMLFVFWLVDFGVILIKGVLMNFPVPFPETLLGVKKVMKTDYVWEFLYGSVCPFQFNVACFALPGLSCVAHHSWWDGYLIVPWLTNISLVKTDVQHASSMNQTTIWSWSSWILVWD